MAFQSEKKFARLADGMLRQWGLKEKAFEQNVAAHWAEAMGEFFARTTFPTGFKNGILYLGVGNSALLQEIFYQKPKMLEKVQAYFGFSVRDIRLSLRKHPGLAAAGAAGKGKAKVEDDPRVRRQAEISAADVGDPAIRDSLVKLFVNSTRRTPPSKYKK